MHLIELAVTTVLCNRIWHAFLGFWLLITTFFICFLDFLLEICDFLRVQIVLSNHHLDLAVWCVHRIVTVASRGPRPLELSWSILPCLRIHIWLK